MITLLAVLAVLAIVFGVAVVLTGRAAVLSDEGQDLADTGIPRNRPMTPQDVVGLRFALALRGYRMAEVDDALDRLAAEIAARDEAIERLRAAGAPAGATPEWAPEPEVLAEAGAVGVWASPAVAEPPGPFGSFEAPAGTAEQPVVPEVPLAAPAAEGAAATAFEAMLAGGGRTALPEPPAAPIDSDNPYRPSVPEIPTYDPWAVTPRSRYTEGPTYVEVEHADDEDVAESVTEHQTGYALPPPATDDEAQQ
ncbi:MAG: hypothetical protein QOE45_3386 [Frankiaceae bacterium]|nr:hypothetical protein [Frankiaceae bacterium]